MPPQTTCQEEAYETVRLNVEVLHALLNLSNILSRSKRCTTMWSKGGLES